MKISIIIPIYNVEQYLTLCLDSVARQTMTNDVECILVDDCGKDRSVEIAKRYIASYKGNINFSLIHRKTNGGLSAARNTGIRAAQGDYLYFLDSDDEVTPDCMERMYALVKQHPDVELVQGSFYETEAEKPTSSPYRFPAYTEEQKKIKSFLLLYEGDIVGAQSRLIQRDFLLKHNLFFKEGIIHEDNHWTFFLAKHVCRMAFCPKRMYYHRYNPAGITGNVNVAKEAVAYRTLIEEFCANIDPFLRGQQMQLVLCTLLTPIRAHYLSKEDAKQLIGLFAQQNTALEIRLLKLYFFLASGFLKTKVLHLLFRLFKIKD